MTAVKTPARKPTPRAAKSPKSRTLRLHPAPESTIVHRQLESECPEIECQERIAAAIGNRLLDSVGPERRAYALAVYPLGGDGGSDGPHLIERVFIATDVEIVELATAAIKAASAVRPDETAAVSALLDG